MSNGATVLCLAAFDRQAGQQSGRGRTVAIVLGQRNQGKKDRVLEEGEESGSARRSVADDKADRKGSGKDSAGSTSRSTMQTCFPSCLHVNRHSSQ
ncbi:hypothetical protein R1flu_008382 [Riccia fluitans]|uniref:Uncharacterized protein n=1 Tax=Riccia fluitans TaxID=41844 RepID=A0ABD1YF47_9MARC